MGAWLKDGEVVERVLGHIAQGTTDVAADVWREPVANYLSEERLRAEIERVLRRAPSAFCPSAALAEPGAYVAREAAGTPLVAVRGEDGKVRAFRNACRHRGMQVASGSGTAKAFPCRYHGWTYGLDGALKRVPHEHGFPGLDKSCHGLAPVAATERCGLVFIIQDGPEDWSSLDDLPEVIPPRQTLHSTNELITEANWKVTLEGFIEGYHIRSTHKDTFYPYGFDNLNVVELVGLHSRVTYPFRRIQKLEKVPPAERRVDGLLTYVYHLFPNALITQLSRHTNLIVLEPLGTDRVRNIRYTLIDRGDGSPQAIADAERDVDFARNSGGAEDVVVIQDIQRALRSRANEAFTFGLFEGAISHFHRNLTRALA
ncbi:MAG TPA: SRPBCC family protein [Burkholderiales bacterium]|nr:SRPBCC family protein [Burkholderiales bacterium]